MCMNTGKLTSAFAYSVRTACFLLEGLFKLRDEDSLETLLTAYMWQKH